MKILGIDYGRAKAGLALGDSITKLTEPFSVIATPNLKNVISKIINENEIEKIVIGLASGSMDTETKEFGSELEAMSSLPVEYFDETLTTQEAQSLLLQGGGRRINRKQKEDAVAAAIMLQYYLEAGKL